MARTKRLVDGAAKSVLVALIGIATIYATWSARTVFGLADRVTAIEASRFTGEDGALVWRELGQIREEAASREPPAWLVDRLDRLERKLDQLADFVHRSSP